MKQNICVVGLGYIGLPTAAIFASAGKTVLGVDLNDDVVRTVGNGEVHIVEPGLETLVREVVEKGLLRTSRQASPSECFVLAVPTPIRADKSADVSYVMDAARSISPLLEKGNLVIVESTSPPGTTRAVADVVRSERPDLIDPDGVFEVLFAHAPERVLPGNALQEIVENDRVLGGLTPEATLRSSELYRSFVRGELLLTDATTAELVKLSENSFRDVNIAFANELSLISEEVGVDVWEVIRLANRHPRVNIMQPGPGVGGHCIAVDPWFIVDAAPSNSRLIKTARQVNDEKPRNVVSTVREAISREPQGSKVALLGLSFKKNIDDLRESPAVSIARELALQEPLTEFVVIEPHVTKLPVALTDFANLNLVSDLDSTIKDANVVVLLVDHDQFGGINPQHLATKSVIDTRGLWAS